MRRAFQSCACAFAVWVSIVGITSGQAVRSEIADAAQRGDRAAVQKLIQAKGDVNAAQVDGATALMWAVYREDVELVDVLIRAGANVKAANRVGMTPLAMASLYGHAPIIDRLLKAGADARELTVNGETMLMFAARNGKWDPLESTCRHASLSIL